MDLFKQLQKLTNQINTYSTTAVLEGLNVCTLTISCGPCEPLFHWIPILERHWLLDNAEVENSETKLKLTIIFEYGDQGKVLFEIIVDLLFQWML